MHTLSSMFASLITTLSIIFGLSPAPLPQLPMDAAPAAASTTRAVVPVLPSAPVATPQEKTVASPSEIRSVSYREASVGDVFWNEDKSAKIEVITMKNLYKPGMEVAILVTDSSRSRSRVLMREKTAQAGTYVIGIGAQTRSGVVTFVLAPIDPYIATELMFTDTGTTEHVPRGKTETVRWNAIAGKGGKCFLQSTESVPGMSDVTKSLPVALVGSTTTPPVSQKIVYRLYCSDDNAGTSDEKTIVVTADTVDKLPACAADPVPGTVVLGASVSVTATATYADTYTVNKSVSMVPSDGRIATRGSVEPGGVRIMVTNAKGSTTCVAKATLTPAKASATTALEQTISDPAQIAALRQAGYPVVEKRYVNKKYGYSVTLPYESIVLMEDGTDIHTPELATSFELLSIVPDGSKLPTVATRFRLKTISDSQSEMFAEIPAANAQVRGSAEIFYTDPMVQVHDATSNDLVLKFFWVLPSTSRYLQIDIIAYGYSVDRAQESMQQVIAYRDSILKSIEVTGGL